MTKKITKKDFITFDEVKRQMFARPGFKEAYDALAPKYALITAMLDARNKRGMTQAEIARRAGTTQSAIARFESGRTNPTLDFAYRLSSAVGAKLEIHLSK
jgi:DNA-binding XRE family transcriptional regulator